MNRRMPVWIVISLCLIVSAVTMVATFLYASYSYGLLQTGGTSAFIVKLQTISQRISRDFYKEVDLEKLQEAALKGYMSGLEDRYAAYYSIEDTAANTADSQGRNVGIGINFLVDSETGYLYIERVHSQSPADYAGICPGDKIAAIAGTTLTLENYNELLDKITESVGTPISISLVRADGSSVVVDVTPGEYASQSVWSSLIGDTAYIYIIEFDATTPDQLKAALEGASGAAKVVFDLRGNPGGTVSSVSACLDYLLPSGDLIVAHYKDGSSKVIETSDGNAALTIPAVVVVDGDTASSGELFALAMRDIYEAPIVGETTFGKGVMQTTYFLEDGSSYKFSTATITSHSGVEYNGVGVVPDVTVKPTDDEKKAALMGPIEKDPVIEMALELLNDMME